MKLSLVILQYGFKKFTEIALQSIEESSVKPDEIILIDNGSLLQEDRDILNDFNGVGIGLPNNLGYIKGTNIGWEKAQGDYILLCNNDIALGSKCIELMIKALEIDPDIGWLSASYQEGPWPNCIVSLPASITEELNNSKGANRKSLYKWEESQLTPSISYCNVTEATVVMVTKKAREKVGVYWDNLTVHHSHDYGLRLLDANLKVAVCNNAVFWHNPHHPSLEIANKDNTYSTNWGASTQFMDARWGSRWREI